MEFKNGWVIDDQMIPSNRTVGELISILQQFPKETKLLGLTKTGQLTSRKWEYEANLLKNTVKFAIAVLPEEDCPKIILTALMKVVIPCPQDERKQI